MPKIFPVRNSAFDYTHHEGTLSQDSKQLSLSTDLLNQILGMYAFKQFSK